MAKRRAHTRRHRKSKRKGSYRKTKSSRNRRSRMYGGRLDRDQKRMLREAIEPVRALMATDNNFSQEVKRFFSDTDIYLDEDVNTSRPAFFQYMFPWLLRNQPLPNDHIEAMDGLVRIIRLLGDSEANHRDIITVLSEESLIDNESLDTLLQSIEDHYHMLNNFNNVVVNPNEI